MVKILLHYFQSLIDYYREVETLLGNINFTIDETRNDLYILLHMFSTFKLYISFCLDFEDISLIIIFIINNRIIAAK